METKPKNVEYYETADGKKPFIEWLEELDIPVRHRILTRFTNLALGNFGDHHAEGKGVWALIFDFGPEYRVYYGLTGDQKIVLLLSGGGKKRQERDIQQAVQYWRDWKARA